MKLLDGVVPELSREEVEAQIDRLASKFGASFYPADARSRIFDEFRRFEFGRLKSAVDGLLSSKTAPMLQDIRSALNSPRAAAHNPFKRKGTGGCSECNGYGYVTCQSARSACIAGCINCNEGRHELARMVKARVNGEEVMRPLMHTIAEAKRNGYTVVRKFSRDLLHVEARARCPWPANLIGLMLCFDDPRGVPASGLKACNVDMDEARFLFDCFKIGDFTNEFAGEILRKVPSASRAFNDLKEKFA